MDKRNPLEAIETIIKAKPNSILFSHEKKIICSRGTSFVCCVADNVFLNSRCKDRTRCMMSEWDYVKELTRDMADQFVGPTIYIRPRNFYFNKDNTDNIHLATFMCAARQDFDDIAFYKLVSTVVLKCCYFHVLTLTRGMCSSFSSLGPKCLSGSFPFVTPL